MFINKNLNKFGKTLKDLRIKKQLSLREMCRLVGYDPSNWSKVERGVVSPPSSQMTLSRWAEVLGLSKGTEEFQNFLDEAMLAQGIIPQDILSREDAVRYLPAFFRTLRNEKPTKQEVDQLIELIRGA